MTYTPRKAWSVTKAREIHKKLEIAEPDEIDIERIAHYHKVATQRLPLSGMDGRIVRDGDSAIITVRDSIQYHEQERFVIAHELGHFFLHPKSHQVDIVTTQQMMNWSDSQTSIEEYEANLFAAEMLMPQGIFSKHIEGATPSFDTIKALAKEFRTTLTATAVQFVLTTKEECALVSCEGRSRKWFVCRENFPFRFLKGGEIHGRSCAAKVNDAKRSDRSELIEAGWWFEGYYQDYKSYITEEAYFFPALGRCLTLLWVKDEI